MLQRAVSRLVLLLCLVAVSVLGLRDAQAGERTARVVARTVPTASTHAAIPAAERPMTALQVAARHGLKYSDAGSFVLMEAGSLRVRVYPGTNTVVIAGRQYRVKDPALRSERAVVLSRRVAGFVNHKIGAYRAEQRLRDMRLSSTPPSRLDPLPPLPTKPKPVKRAPAPQRRPQAKPAAQTTAASFGPQPGWLPRAQDRKWRWIVIHHSDDEHGNMAKYDDYHRNDKGWEHGCGYHFVIGNGTLSGDGEVEAGPRWPPQLHGAHAKTPDNRFNDYGIGICLVGDFHRAGGRPTRAQMDSLVHLVGWLQERYGISDADVRGHCDCCSTECPGQHFPWSEFKRRLR